MKQIHFIFSILASVIILFCVWYAFQYSMPQADSEGKIPVTEFSTNKALEHVKNIAKATHYTGSNGHTDTKNYIVSELKKLGLQPTIQKGFNISSWGQLANAQNIIAKIKGSDKGKALVLMSHYDSNPHSSYGASDAGSGVATILEGVRAFMAQNKAPKNDIIICITDAEEIGLNGASLFVNEHPWAKEAGLVLNFEARGSGGPSYMLLESNGKNSTMIKEFIKANPQYPVTNSLAYSIYKLLPNDTDLTIFREDGDIDGYNFAFIDDHFDYHTANDTWENLDFNTLTHQGSYLMPMLLHFSRADLSNLKSTEDLVYFNFPIVKMVSYPFAWNFILVGVALVLFILFFIYGKKRRRIQGADVGSGFLAFIISVGLSVALSMGFWKLILIVYPQFQDMLHGFTYNGYFYIGASVLIGIAAFFKVYSIFDTAEQLPSVMVAPLFFWIVICGGASVYLPGAGYLIIPVLLALICFFLMITFKRPIALLTVIFCIPAIFILVPFIASFPVALGLKILFASAALTVLLCVLLLPIFGYFSKGGWVGTIAFILAIVCLGISHFYSDFNEERQRPNSLIYFDNADKGKAHWATYDHVIDEWTKNHINRLKNVAKDFEKNAFHSKYNNSFSYVTPVENYTSFPTSSITASYDTIKGDTRYMDICIKPKRKLNRMDVYVNKEFNFKKLQANGVMPKDVTYKDGNTYNEFTNRWNDRLLTYFIKDNEPLELRMEFPKDAKPEFVIYESSYDLLEQEAFDIKPRPKDMMPKPFVINDAIMVKKTIDISAIKKVVDTTTTTLESINVNE